MAGNPIRFLASSWPWRCLAYLVSATVVASTAWWLVLMGMLFPPSLVLVGLPVGAVERRRLRLVDPDPAADPHGRPEPGPLGWLQRRVTEAATWRELAYTACLITVLFVVDGIALFALFLCAIVLALPLLMPMDGSLVNVEIGAITVNTVGQAWLVAGVVGVPLTILTGYGMCALAGGQAAFARWVLAPTEAELRRTVDELAESRTRLVDAFEAERRRIERDLHDGAQQHLVLMTMNLGLAELELAGDGARGGGGDGGRGDGDGARGDGARGDGGRAGRAGELVADAHRQAKLALAAMRELIHGIHPQVLTDLGLPAAIGELAERSRVAVDVDVALPHRLPAQVESTAYFVVSEALTNAVRHAQADRITVIGAVVGDDLVMEITDNGTGGADPRLGTGLRGLVDRTAVLGGSLTIDSPLGGPTTLRTTLPCRIG
jgi:signal transduction histidine kinase